MSKKKEDLKDQVANWFVAADLQTNCKVAGREITKFIYSAKTYADLWRQIKYLRELEVVFNNWKKMWNWHNEKQWEQLKRLNPTLPEFKMLEECAKLVRVKWRKRVRF